MLLWGRCGGVILWLTAFRVPQATAWQLISPVGDKPNVRQEHAAAWSDTADGLYIHGGYDGSRALSKSVRSKRIRGRFDDLWFFARQAGFVAGECLSFLCRKSWAMLTIVRIIEAATWVKAGAPSMWRSTAPTQLFMWCLFHVIVDFRKILQSAKHHCVFQRTK